MLQKIYKTFQGKQLFNLIYFLFSDNFIISWWKWLTLGGLAEFAGIIVVKSVIILRIIEKIISGDYFAV